MRKINLLILFLFTFTSVHFLNAQTDELRVKITGGSDMSYDGKRLQIFNPNLIIGQDAGSSIGVSANRNTLLGQEAGKSITNTMSNTFVGYRSGANNSGSGNVFLGQEAGLNELGSDKLYISNSSTSFPLIFGDFESRTLTVNNNLNVAEDATINKNLTVNQTLIVDGPSTAANQILQSTNPYLMFKSGLTEKYSIKYESSSDKFIIEEIGGGNVLEIKDGELYLPDYSGSSTVNLSVDSNGKLIKAPRNNQKFGRYEYYDIDTSNHVYFIARKSVVFEDNTTVKGISALLLDNNSGTGGATNTNFVYLSRTARSSVTGFSEEIYRITGNNTATGIYNNQTSTTLKVSGANVIDNANYLYFLVILYCNDCDFRELSILE